MLAYSTLASVMADMDQPAYRARQVYEALTRGLAFDFAEITTLPVALRRALAARLRAFHLEPPETWQSRRGDVVKALFCTADGAPVESVLMKYARRGTVCVSSQSGCAVRCAFCASGREGLRRDLAAEEIADQVAYFARVLRESGGHVTNVVVMGMGEPFLNYEETLGACELLNDPSGFGLAARAISISTAGVEPGIERFAREPHQYNLAVSLHAATDELRTRLVPLNRKYPLRPLLDACARYVQGTRRKLFFEWVVLPGINDTEEQAVAAGHLLRRPLYHVNLIPYNAATGDYRCPTAAEVEAFRARLARAGIACTVRHSPGGEIEAACGQLALHHAASA